MSTTTQEAYQTIVEQLSDLQNYVGKEVGISDWIQVSQQMINEFAENTGDHQWIHIDEERAATQSPYKTTIAHGFLVLSLASQLVPQALKLENIAMGINYGLNRVRFTNATKAGAYIRARVSLKEVTEIEGGLRYINEIVFEIQGEDKPACIAEWIGLAYTGPKQEATEEKEYATSTENGSKPSEVLFRREGNIGVITLNRPERYNGITAGLLDAFSEALDQAVLDNHVRAVIIHGNGKGFCAGADLGGDRINRNPRQVRDFLNMHYGNVVRRIVEMHKPVIAAIHGAAAGAGLGFALACDFRVMADTANMRYAFANIALAPDAGSSWFLTRTVGYSKALQIATEAKKIPAAECLQLGLTNKVVPEAELMAATMEWASQLAERAPLAFAATKKDIQYGMNHGLLDTIAFEAEQQVQLLASQDNREGVKAFFEKRKPKFVGK